MQYEEFGMKMEAEKMVDLIGTIHNSGIYEIFGFHKVTTERERKSWEVFAKALGSMAGDASDMEKEDVESLALSFGNQREETGFKIGFHMAMQLCMEGLNGGVR